MSDSLSKPGLPENDSPTKELAPLEKLAAQLPDAGVMYACVSDLFEHGPIGMRGTPVVSRPSRSVITHYLAKWARSIGLSQEACLEWLIPYTVSALKGISTSSPGEIRHNTKGIVKYVYNVGYPFNCGKEQNPMQCRCDAECRLYHQPETPLPKHVPSAPEAGIGKAGRPRVLGRVKDHYREAFEKSLLVIQEMRASGKKPGAIIERLNAEKLPTKIGKTWSAGTLNNACRDLLKAERARRES